MQTIMYGMEKGGPATQRSDSIQYPVISHNGKGYEEGYMYITESLCCTAEINTTLQINYTSIKF